MELLNSLIYFVFFIWELVHSQESFSINLSEEVVVVNTFSNIGCFNKTISGYQNITTRKFKLSRGVITQVAYEGINPLGKGESLLSFKAEFKCCSIFCERFSRQLSDWAWLSGKVTMDVAEEPSAGIYYNGELVCHSNYLEGFFAGVQFTPFELEGGTIECVHKKRARYIKTYSAVGNVQRITAEYSSSTITVKFAFSLIQWSRNFMMKFMKENEHGTLVNINADIVLQEVKQPTSGIDITEFIFMALTAFTLFVILFATVIVLCMRTKLGFLSKTWVVYDEYKKLKQQRQAEYPGVNNIGLEEM